MIITTWDYDDFKNLVSDLMTAPKVYSNTSENGWRAQAIGSGIAVTIYLGEEPASFTTDYPSHVDLSLAISIS